jgi:hydroxypyruvate isomerase
LGYHVNVMTRRTALRTTAGLAAAAAVPAAPAPAAGRLKQSACKWCYPKVPFEDLCRQGAAMGLSGIDLVQPPDWPTIQKHGLTPAVTTGSATIPNGWNRKENHDKLEAQMKTNIVAAEAAKVPNVITFSGNRAGMSDDEGKANTIEGLKRVAKFAEEHKTTIILELLNSKVDHKDYMADHTKWGVEVMKAVDSPRVKLLYDIYHMQIMEGDVIRTIRDNIQWIGHFHTGGVPGRHEIDDTQELRWRDIAMAIADLKFEGYVAHEFIPVREPLASLKQAIEIFTV